MSRPRTFKRASVSWNTRVPAPESAGQRNALMLRQQRVEPLGQRWLAYCALPCPTGPTALFTAAEIREGSGIDEMDRKARATPSAIAPMATRRAQRMGAHRKQQPAGKEINAHSFMKRVQPIAGPHQHPVRRCSSRIGMCDYDGGAHSP